MMISAIISCLIQSLAIVLCVAVYTVVDRTVLGLAQRRLGCWSIGTAGILHAVFDGVKLATKNSVTLGYVVLGTFSSILLLVIATQTLVQSSLSLTAASVQVV
jgi:NADH:ubiquinone oxidoreductase subunit H